MKKSMVKKTKPKTNAPLLKEYAATLTQIKTQIKQAQTKAILAANKELIKLYWCIGEIITDKQKTNGWGKNIVERLAYDLQNEFPGMGGFSERNVFRMQAFYLAYEKLTQAASEIANLPVFNIPWFHNIVILQKIKNTEERLWYAQKAIEYGWSRSMLETWIQSDLYRREGKAITNFKKTLPAPHSDMAQQSFKDPYIFDFLTLHKDHVEHDLEQGLIHHVQKLLLELGKGFALVGRQYHLQVSDKDFYIDLLFYHYKLHCFVVVELKSREFDPRDAGQLNFYLSAVDDMLRNPEDKPTIGLLLCKTKDNFIAEYALRDINKPIGVAEYETTLLKKLPKELKSSLPSIQEIEAELEKTEELQKQEIKQSKQKHGKK